MRSDGDVRRPVLTSFEEIPNPFFWLCIFITMKKVIRLSESELVHIVKQVIVESEIPSYIEPYLESECVTYKKVGNYIVIDVQSPMYFMYHGFDKEQGIRIKQRLRNDNFISIGVGEYVKKIV